jgi:hypothetical protein
MTLFASTSGTRPLLRECSARSLQSASHVRYPRVETRCDIGEGSAMSPATLPIPELTFFRLQRRHLSICVVGRVGGNCSGGVNIASVSFAIGDAQFCQPGDLRRSRGLRASTPQLAAVGTVFSPGRSRPDTPGVFFPLAELFDHTDVVAHDPSPELMFTTRSPLLRSRGWRLAARCVRGRKPPGGQSHSFAGRGVCQYGRPRPRRSGWPKHAPTPHPTPQRRR